MSYCNNKQGVIFIANSLHRVMYWGSHD